MLLDTTFLIDLMDGEAKAIARAKAMEQAGTEVRIPTPALFELWRGVHLAAGSFAEASRVARALASYGTAPLDSTAAARGGEVDAILIRGGTPIDPEDAMIAGIALVRGDAVLTRSVRHFSRVSGLKVETY